MFNLFSKGRFSALLVLSLTTINLSLQAYESYDSYQCYDPCECYAPCSRLYIGGFSGELFSDSTKFSQMGTAFFEEALGGPLAVFAEGSAKKKTIGYGGAQIGYEWSQGFSLGCSGWTLAPAVELEALFYSHKPKGHLTNPTDRLPEHDFVDSFKLTSSVILANIVLSLNNTSFWGLTPYVGGGIGAIHVSLRDAKSIQVDPVEAGINHFNSRRHDTDWTFAAQAKVGLRYNICNAFHIFAEYRYLFVDSSNFILGSTVYPDHAPTSPWNVKLNNINYNAFAVGLQYDL